MSLEASSPAIAALQSLVVHNVNSLPIAKTMRQEQVISERNTVSVLVSQVISLFSFFGLLLRFFGLL